MKFRQHKLDYKIYPDNPVNPVKYKIHELEIWSSTHETEDNYY